MSGTDSVFALDSPTPLTADITVIRARDHSAPASHLSAAANTAQWLVVRVIVRSLGDQDQARLRGFNLPDNS